MKQFRLLLVRHAPAVDASICYGRCDVKTHAPPEDYRRLSHTISELSKGKKTRIWSSPALRCLEVTQKLGFTSPQQDPLLQELNFGLWEGIAWKDLEKREDFTRWMKNWQRARPPEGETLEEIMHRASSWYKNLKPAEVEVVFTHAGIVRALQSILDKKRIQDVMSQKVPHLTPLVWDLPFPIEARCS